MDFHWNCLHLHCNHLFPAIITTHSYKQTLVNPYQTVIGLHNGCHTEHTRSQWPTRARPRASHRHHYEHDSSSCPPHRIWRCIRQSITCPWSPPHGHVVPGRLDSARQQERGLLRQVRPSRRRFRHGDIPHGHDGAQVRETIPSSQFNAIDVPQTNADSQPPAGSQ